MLCDAHWPPCRQRVDGVLAEGTPGQGRCRPTRWERTLADAPLAGREWKDAWRVVGTPGAGGGARSQKPRSLDEPLQAPPPPQAHALPAVPRRAKKGCRCDCSLAPCVLQVRVGAHGTNVCSSCSGGRWPLSTI